MHPLCKKIYEGYQPDFQEIVKELSPFFPLLTQLINTPQDPEWHAEGNVHVHTQMVLDALYMLINSRQDELGADELLILILAAALHDISKPQCTRTMEIRGIERVAAPNHEYRGGSYIAYKLADLGLPFAIIYQIISLVVNHIKPKLLIVKNSGLFDYKKVARATNIKLLYYLEKADMMGRHCKDQKEQIDNIELFKIFAKEYGIWPDSDPYQDWRHTIEHELCAYPAQTRQLVLANTIKDAEHGLIAMAEEGIARSFSYRDEFAELIILCGPSGAGKSTWIKNNASHYNVIALDQLRKELTGKQSDQSKNGEVLQAAKKALKTHLAKKRKVIWDATNLRKDFRSQIAESGYAYKALVTIVWFYGPISSFYLQNKERTERVADSVLQRQLDFFEWPELTESHCYKVIDSTGTLIFER